MRSAEILNEIEDELGIRRHHNDSGAERTCSHMVRDSCPNGLFRRFGTIVRMKTW